MWLRPQICPRWPHGWWSWRPVYHLSLPQTPNKMMKLVLQCMYDTLQQMFMHDTPCMIPILCCDEWKELVYPWTLYHLISEIIFVSRKIPCFRDCYRSFDRLYWTKPIPGIDYVGQNLFPAKPIPSTKPIPGIGYLGQNQFPVKPISRTKPIPSIASKTYSQHRLCWTKAISGIGYVEQNQLSAKGFVKKKHIPGIGEQNLIWGSVVKIYKKREHSE